MPGRMIDPAPSAFTVDQGRLIANPHVVANRPLPLVGLEVLDEGCLGRVIEQGVERALAVVVVLAVEVRDGLPFHVRLAGEDEDLDRLRRVRRTAGGNAAGGRQQQQDDRETLVLHRVIPDRMIDMAQIGAWGYRRLSRRNHEIELTRLNRHHTWSQQ